MYGFSLLSFKQLLAKNFKSVRTESKSYHSVNELDQQVPDMCNNKKETLEIKTWLILFYNTVSCSFLYE